MENDKTASCDPNSGCCNPNKEEQYLARRNFIKQAALGMGFLAFPNPSIFAGPLNFDQEPHLIPEDKKLSPEWVKSLFERGQPEIYTKGQLKYIGMPIGGIACGQLYLGGDGRLWLWHIFKTEYSREKDHGQRFDAMTLGGHYKDPDKVFAREKRPLEQGAAIRIKTKQGVITKGLNAKGFPDVSFRGEYPIGKVSYQHHDLPITIDLEAFSPFIPLNVEDSALPTTIMNYRVTNNSDSAVELELISWLENAVCPFIGSDVKGERTSELSTSDNAVTLYYDASENLKEEYGYGSMALSVLNDDNETAAIIVSNSVSSLDTIFDELDKELENASKTSSLAETSIGVLGKALTLKPGESKDISFTISWFFPYLNQQEKETGQLLALDDIKHLKLHYYNRFLSAKAVSEYVADNYTSLTETTRLWNKTWYDSTLPYWLLDRSFISLDCLATNTVLWFNNGRFWGWEGVECCPGTCQHVWQYAQGMAHIFPLLERKLREEIDYGRMLNENGSLGHRDETAGNYGSQVAHDGHCGTIMRVYREHKMCKDDAFLKRNYSKVKKSVQFIISEDRDRDGLLEGGQHNTLDASWYGPMGWISSLYLGALAAGKEMAVEVGDHDFANSCDALLKKGQKNIVEQLYNGEYFIHKPDTNHPNAINTNDGCHIDQVLGQSFGWQIGLSERVLPEHESQSALKSIWKYNFAPDAFLYQKQNKPIKGARIYATEGEAGTIMCTWPKGGVEKAVPGMDKRPDESETWLGPGGYFDEAMNGFEYQVAAHMVYEGLLLEGLATIRAVHDRYHPIARNPYNEIECSDHYSRSMASYGVFLAVCGFDYHGPKGHLSFNPKLTPEHFKAPFTVAEGWGSFGQERTTHGQINTIDLNYGKLALKKLSLPLEDNKGIKVRMFLNGKRFNCNHDIANEMCHISCQGLTLHKGDVLKIDIR